VHLSPKEIQGAFAKPDNTTYDVMLSETFRFEPVSAVFGPKGLTLKNAGIIAHAFFGWDRLLNWENQCHSLGIVVIFTNFLIPDDYVYLKLDDKQLNVVKTLLKLQMSKKKQ